MSLAGENETPLPDDHPIMVAWNQFKQEEFFKNTITDSGDRFQRQWLLGILWTAFLAGYKASELHWGAFGKENL